MRVKSSVLLDRHFNSAGQPTEEPRTFEVLIAADVVNDEVGAIEVTDAPEMDGPLKQRVLAFHPLRGHELVRAAEACWTTFLEEEKRAHEEAQKKAWMEMARKRAIESVVASTLERARKARLNPRDVLAALAGALEGQ